MGSHVHILRLPLSLYPWEEFIASLTCGGYVLILVVIDMLALIKRMAYLSRCCLLRMWLVQKRYFCECCGAHVHSWQAIFGGVTSISISSLWELSVKFFMELLDSCSLLLCFQLKYDIVIALSRESTVIKSFPFESITGVNSITRGRYIYIYRSHLDPPSKVPLPCFIPFILTSIFDCIFFMLINLLQLLLVLVGLGSRLGRIYRPV